MTATEVLRLTREYANGDTRGESAMKSEQPDVITALYAVDINQLRNTSTEDLQKLVK